MLTIKNKINSYPIRSLAYVLTKHIDLINIMASKQDLIYKALQVDSHREYGYCKKLENSLIERVNNIRPETRSSFANIWYEGYENRTTHYNRSRYHGLNLHTKHHLKAG